VWHERFPTHKYVCWTGGWNLKILAKNTLFLVLSGKKQSSPLLFPPTKTFRKIHLCRPQHISFRRPCTQACKISPFL